MTSDIGAETSEQAQFFCYLGRYLLQRRFLLDLDKIVSELKSERDRIGRAISALLEGAGLASAARRTKAKAASPKRGKGITPAGRKRLSQAMKARWAARKSKPSSTSGATTPVRLKPRGGMSTAGRKRIAEAMRKRWAEKKKAAMKAGG
jgi:hypothetical protein